MTAPRIQTAADKPMTWVEAQSFRIGFRARLAGKSIHSCTLKTELLEAWTKGYLKCDEKMKGEGNGTK